MDVSDSTKQQVQVWSHQPVQASSLGENNEDGTVHLSSLRQQQQQLASDSSRQLAHRSHRRSKRNRRESKPSTTETSTDASASTSTITPTTWLPQPLQSIFQCRPLSLDRGAIAPGLARPTAPFAKSERKRAFVSAIYYSECFLRSIRPKDADSAAFDIQNQYTKWWVQSKKSSTTTATTAAAVVSNPLNSDKDLSVESSNHTTTSDGSHKRRRLDQDATPTASATTTASRMTPKQLAMVKDQMIEHLQKTGGDTTTDEFQDSLDQLREAHASNRQTIQEDNDPSSSSSSELFNIDGTWLTLSKPTFSECQGRNTDGEYLYSLGRMSFDMFRPNHLKCSIRAVMNNIRVMDPKHKPQSFPHRLGKELEKHNANSNKATDTPIRHYDIVVAFTIEANQTRQGTTRTAESSDTSSSTGEFVVPRPIRGLMTNHGYLVADPSDPNRSSVWFSGGSIEAQDEVADGEIWKQIFDESLAPRRDMRAMANVLAAKLLLGAYSSSTSYEDIVDDTATDTATSKDGDERAVPTMSYFFKRPIGGHGEVFCDALYVDETLRIMQGHRGSIFVSTRVPTFEDVAEAYTD